MKILHVINYYQEGFGYQENWLARSQKKAGHEVVVVSSDYYFPFPDYERTMKPRLGSRHVGEGIFEDGGVTIIRKRSFFAGLNRAGIIFFSISSTLREFCPDVVHVHGPTSFCLPEIMALRKRIGYKVFVDCHQDDVVSSDDGLLMKRIYHGCWRIFYHGFGMRRRVSRFLPITEGSRHWLKSRLQISDDQITVLPLGVDLEGMSYDEAAGKEFRRKHGIGGRLVMVNAGKQYAGKRIEWVIDVFQESLRLGADVFLVLVGNADASYDRVLKDRLGPFDGKYTRLPFLRREELRQVYSAADVGIWPGIPSNTIQEAMACGVAVILPDNDIVGHLVDGNGLHESEDTEKAAGFIDELFRDAGRREAAKKRSIDIAKKHDWRLIADDLMRVYEG